jgi:hypothetical protein
MRDTRGMVYPHKFYSGRDIHVQQRHLARHATRPDREVAHDDPA